MVGCSSFTTPWVSFYQLTATTIGHECVYSKYVTVDVMSWWRCCIVLPFHLSPALGNISCFRSTFCCSQLLCRSLSSLKLVLPSADSFSFYLDMKLLKGPGGSLALLSWNLWNLISENVSGDLVSGLWVCCVCRHGERSYIRRGKMRIRVLNFWQESLERTKFGISIPSIWL